MRTAFNRWVAKCFILVLLVGCARGPTPTGLPPPTEIPTTAPASEAPPITPTPCLQTPYSTTRPPDPHTASFTETWFGNEALWAGLAPPYNGNWYAGPNGLKVLWFRSVPGKLRVEGKRLDAVAPGLQADIPDGYGDWGYQASGLIFPSVGCWEVIGTVADKELRFVVRVHPADENPVR